MISFKLGFGVYSEMQANPMKKRFKKKRPPATEVMQCSKKTFKRDLQTTTVYFRTEVYYLFNEPASIHTYVLTNNV